MPGIHDRYALGDQLEKNTANPAEADSESMDLDEPLSLEEQAPPDDSDAETIDLYELDDDSSARRSRARKAAKRNRGASRGSHRRHSDDEESLIPDPAKPAEIKYQADTHSVNYNLPPAQVNQRRIYRDNPTVYYMNGESLSRPMFLPRKERIGLVILAGVATIIACIALFCFFDATANQPMREQAQVDQVLSQDTQIDLPHMLEFVDKSDEEIDAILKEQGGNYFEKSPVGSGQPYEIIKLPADVTIEQAIGYYATGLSKLTALQAVTLLNGAWDLDIDRSKGLNMSLHYADFKSSSVRNAITGAVDVEDFERGGEGDSGEDDGFGNAYSTGSIMINGQTYTWTVSAIPLKQVYSIAGLPENSVYVGIRIKNA